VEVLAEARRLGEGGLAGDGVEGFPAELEARGGGEASVGAEAGGDVLDEDEEAVLEDGLGADVVGEGMLAGEGFFAGVELDGAGVLAKGESAEVGGGVGADDGFEDGQGGVLELADGMDAGAVEGGLRDLADAPDLADGQGTQEGDDAGAVEGDDGEAVGLAVFAAELGEELVGGDADGAGEAELGADGVLDLSGDGFGRSEEAEGAGDVEEGFVDGDGFDERREAVEDVEDLAGDGGVAGAVWGQEDGVGAELMGFRGGHGGVDAVAAGFVGGGGDDAAFGGRGADDDGAPGELGAVADFDRGEEGVHVDMEEDAAPCGGVGGRGLGGGGGQGGGLRRRGGLGGGWGRRRGNAWRSWR